MPFPTRSVLNPRRSSRRAGVVALALAIALTALVSVAGAGRAVPIDTATTTAADQVHRSCPAPRPGYFACLSSWKRLQPVPADRIAAAGRASSAAAGRTVSKPKDGLTPADLRAAYKLPAKGGKGVTIGIVDAYDHPKAESDLKVYRSAFGLSACTTKNTCFRKVNQAGGKKLPAPDADWAGETALDIQAVSAICPQCRILLVEADDPSTENLAAAVRTAVRLGADVVSNSYGAPEAAAEVKRTGKAYRHQNVPIVVASGDDGFTRASYPANLPYVWAVGGTVLSHRKGKGWSEKAWSHGGSGCSDVVAKPAFQKDTLCVHRTIADVSVVADGFAVYNTFGLGEDNGWIQVSGTSLSAPLLAAMMGLSGHPAKAADPKYGYRRAAYFQDITSGRNGTCPDGLCVAGPGYDAPTGIGAPRGVKGLGKA